jgi:hypothetical protein
MFQVVSFFPLTIPWDILVPDRSSFVVLCIQVTCYAIFPAHCCNSKKIYYFHSVLSQNLIL